MTIRILDSFYRMSDQPWDEATAAKAREVWERLKTVMPGNLPKIEINKPVVRPIDRLDDYERELCCSSDPSDHSSLMMRLLMKERNIDPDTVELVSMKTRHGDSEGVVVEEVPMHFDWAIDRKEEV